MSARLGLAAGGALVVIIVVLLVSGGSSQYVINAEFRDAGQLIPGDLVEVGGISIGSIAKIELTPDGLADLVLHIKRDQFTPLHQGTVATIGTVGLSGVANRFISLTPGPTNTPAYPSGATLPTSQTRPIVDLDELLDSLTPPVRSDVQTVVQQGENAFAGTAKAANRAFHYLNPALDQLGALTSQLSSEDYGLRELIDDGAAVASTLAAHSNDLEQGISNTATTLQAVASERDAFEDALSRAPAVLNQTTATLAPLRTALQDVQPALRLAEPVAGPLAGVLRRFVPTARAANPALEHLLHLLPSLETALNGLPPVASVGVPALNSTSAALQQLLPIVTGLRPYTPDAVQGILHGLGGGASSDYDANGHFVRVAALGSPGSPLGQLLGASAAPLEALINQRTGLTKTCPGGVIAPADDKSNPFIPNASLCDPSDDLTAP
jgi:phospholipid/cholesterol/gamma-HCH transport system substrate-binding protein